MSATATLDIECTAALREYLRRTGQIGPSEEPAIRVLAGGVSNRTVWVERPAGPGWVLKQALAKLRVPVDWFSSPDRIHREALGLRWLPQLAPPGSIPPLVFEDRAEQLVAMAAVPSPHETWKTLLLCGQIDPAHFQQFGQLLGTIQRAADARRAELATVFADRSYFESLRLEPYYEYSAAQVPAAAGFLRALVAETRRCQDTLVHGDFSPKNILVHQGRLVLLDHEVIHWGDAAFDPGFALTHLLSKAHHLPSHRAALAAAAVGAWQSYGAAVADLPWAAQLEARTVRHALGCLLARVAGRSTLDYLDDRERARQAAVTVRLMAAAPPTVARLVEEFLACL